MMMVNAVVGVCLMKRRGKSLVDQTSLEESRGNNLPYKMVCVLFSQPKLVSHFSFFRENSFFQDE